MKAKRRIDLGQVRKAAELFAANRFVITRQVHHSPSNRGDAVDLVAFVNGLPVFTFELKNNIPRVEQDGARLARLGQAI